MCFASDGISPIRPSPMVKPVYRPHLNQGFSPILSSALGEAAHVWKGTEIQVENWDYGQLIGLIADLRTVAGWWFGTCFPYIGKNHPN